MGQEAQRVYVDIRLFLVAALLCLLYLCRSIILNYKAFGRREDLLSCVLLLLRVLREAQLQDVLLLLLGIVDF